MPAKTALEQIPAQAWGLGLAFSMSIMRVYLNKSERSILRAIAESFICVGLTFAVISVIKAMGVDENYYIAAGAFIGHIGTQSIRVLAIKLAEKKIDKL